MSVQIGFVAGTFASALLNLPDIVSSRRLFAASALLGAAANAAFAGFADGLAVAVALRFRTGLFLAGIYPPGMKLAATWSRRYRGLAIRLLVGALTVGPASPHLVRAVADFPWRQVVLLSSVMAVLGGGLVMGPGTGGAVRGADGAVPAAPHIAHHYFARRPSGELRLPRSHVGAVRDVDVGARVSRRGDGDS